MSCLLSDSASPFSNFQQLTSALAPDLRCFFFTSSLGSGFGGLGFGIGFLSLSRLLPRLRSDSLSSPSTLREPRTTPVTGEPAALSSLPSSYLKHTSEENSRRYISTKRLLIGQLFDVPKVGAGGLAKTGNLVKLSCRIPWISYGIIGRVITSCITCITQGGSRCRC